MIDSNNQEIKVSDIILYGYGFYSAPLVGIVTKLHKNSFSYTYNHTNMLDVITCLNSICKRPDYCTIINSIVDDKLIDLFKLNQLFQYVEENHRLSILI